MAVKTSAVGVFVLLFEVVRGYYCDSDKCSDDEYCCGYNLCCKSYKVWDLWYFWCGVLFFLFLLSMCACVWRLRTRTSILIGGYTYSPVNQQPTCVQSHTPMSTAPVMMSQRFQPFSDPRSHPPPYSSPSLIQNKASSPPPAYAQVISQRESNGN